MNKTPQKKHSKKQLKEPARGSRVSKRLKLKGKSAESHARPNKKTLSKTVRSPRKPEAPQPARQLTADELAYRSALADFENALKLLNGNQIAKARALFERVTKISASDLAQRARIYLNVCNQRLSGTSVQLKTAEDYYNYGVRMANQGNLEEAEESLTKALKLAPKSDYIHYALASASALKEEAEVALQHLEKAIELNAQNRFLAQNDPDFASLGEDPRFTELIYPEKPPLT